MTPLNDRHTDHRVDLDQAFRALGHSTRRRILTALAQDDPLLRPALEAGPSGSGGMAGETVAVELRHTHLPLLDELDLVDWDRETGRITRGASFAAIRPLLELLDGHRDELPDGWP